MRIVAAAVLISGFAICFIAVMVIHGPAAAADWVEYPVASLKLAVGENPAPVRLVRPAAAPLSAMAQLGKLIFFDPSLSSSGRLACASCHSPARDYGPPAGGPAMFGGPALASQGVRAVPSLMYLQYQPNFSIGPDPAGDNETPVALPQLAAAGKMAARATKTARSTAQSAANIVPQGGLFWDGRANTLQSQGMGPLLSPFEMDGGSVPRVSAILQASPFANRFTQLFGPQIFASPNLAVAEALFAVARYQIEDPSFHPYSSKYDAWLEGKTRLSAAEMRGYVLFNDPAKGDCAACHLDQPTPDRQPPLFTDHQFEALGVPRNVKLMVNKNTAYFDLGVCGPYRSDLTTQTQYCGMFLTPTLRNAATRQVFFHNGVDETLSQVLAFYDFRDTEPTKVYPRNATARAEKFNDLPKRDWANIDTADPPLDRHAGQAPALSGREENDIIAFLKTLDDGYEVVPAGS